MKRVVQIAAMNMAVLLILLILVELSLGNWIRPVSLRDLRRFSIPIGVSYTFDPSALYSSGISVATYTRDEWGLRGSARSLEEIDVVTVGGSTTEQRYLDDRQTWQAVAERELRRVGQPSVFTNAGVDGQSTIGHMFNLRYWFPLLEGLRPRIVLFYVGANDVLMSNAREAYDRSVDASSWRAKSVLFQLYRVIRGNLRAREVGVAHGRSRPDPAEFTERGLLTGAERESLANEVSAAFLDRIDALQRYALAWGAVPVFVTQTAYGWNADHHPPRGMRGEVRIYGRTANFADVAFLHQQMNRRLMKWCAAHHLSCFDLAAEVSFVADDYYDPLHNTPSGSERIGRYLAERISGLDPALLAPRQ